MIYLSTSVLHESYYWVIKTSHTLSWLVLSSRVKSAIFYTEDVSWNILVQALSIMYTQDFAVIVHEFTRESRLYDHVWQFIWRWHGAGPGQNWSRDKDWPIRAQHFLNWPIRRQESDHAVREMSASMSIEHAAITVPP